jgi:hypothetical protein
MPRLTVGSKVTFVFGHHAVIVTVIEDRGNLGAGGRRRLRVRFEIEGANEPVILEIPADDVRLAA